MDSTVVVVTNPNFSRICMKQPTAYNISQEICTRFCCALLCCGYAMNSHEVFIHIHQGCFAGTGAIVRLPQCQWSKPDGYGIISQCITTTKHSKAKTVCIFLGIYCSLPVLMIISQQHNAVYICYRISVPEPRENYLGRSTFDFTYDNSLYMSPRTWNHIDWNTC